MRLALWQTLERPEILLRLPDVMSAIAQRAAALSKAPADGSVSAAVPAQQLLELVLALTEGRITRAGNPQHWTDAQRGALRLAVATITTPAADHVPAHHATSDPTTLHHPTPDQPTPVELGDPG